MWNQIKISVCGIVVLLCSAAAVTTSDSYAQATVAGLQIDLNANSGYFIVTRLDPRLCPSPLCGGYFVKQVNKARTQCADGTWQGQCHAAELDTAALGWSDKEIANFSVKFGHRHALVRGKLRHVERGSIMADVLVVDEGWLGQALSKPIGTFYAAKASGIVCITFPCPLIRERKLNFRAEQLITEVGLAASGAAEEQVAAGYKALSELPGILVVGEHQVVAGPVGTGIKLVASEFYLLLEAEKPPEGQACGGFIGQACPSGQFCDVNIPNACGGADLPGICRIPPQICAQVYAPVCGCDGVTYGNDCERQAALIQMDHPGECSNP